MNPARAARGLKHAAAAILAAAALVAHSAAVMASDVVNVTIDFATLMKLDRPFKDVVIGNPGIFNVAVQSDTSLVLTGKAAGTTNMIILDKDGKEIANTMVRVSSDIRQLTTVFYGKNRQTFSCAPTCEQVISVGDNADAFSNAQSQIQARQQFSGAE